MATPVNSNQRERYLLMLFPTALILAIYSVFFAYPYQQAHRAQLRSFRTAQETATSVAEANSARDQLESSRQSLNRLKSKIQSSQQAIQERGNSWRNLDDRLDTFQQVTEALFAHNLSVVYQGYTIEPTISNYYKNLAAIIDRQLPEQKLEYWEVEVQGTYPDMTKFLMAINDQKMNIIPLTISMKSDSQSTASFKSWKIVFLI